MGKKKIQNNIVSDFGFEEYISALHRFRKETGREPTAQDRDRIAEETRNSYYKEAQGPS